MEAVGAAPLPVVIAELANHFFDAGVDVCAVECSNTCVVIGTHVGNRGGAIHAAMVTGELPTPFENT